MRSIFTCTTFFHLFSHFLLLLCVCMPSFTFFSFTLSLLLLLCISWYFALFSLIYSFVRHQYHLMYQQKCLFYKICTYKMCEGEWQREFGQKEQNMYTWCFGSSCMQSIFDGVCTHLVAAVFIRQQQKRANKYGKKHMCYVLCCSVIPYTRYWTLAEKEEAEEEKINPWEKFMHTHQSALAPAFNSKSNTFTRTEHMSTTKTEIGLTPPIECILSMWQCYCRYFLSSYSFFSNCCFILFPFFLIFCFFLYTYLTGFF